jgi:hypothetical protein
MGLDGTHWQQLTTYRTKKGVSSILQVAWRFSISILRDLFVKSHGGIAQNTKLLFYNLKVYSKIERVDKVRQHRHRP